MRRLILTIAVVLALPSAALAQLPAAPEPSHAGRATPVARCAPVRGNATLEEQARVKTDPDGNPVVNPCPAGSVRVVTSHVSAHRHVRAKETGAGPEQGYYHVSEGWQSANFKYPWKIDEAWYSVAFSSPEVPQNAAEGAHTVMQDWVANESCKAAVGKTLCTLEIGWEKELHDQAEGFKGSIPFCYYTASDYKPEGSGYFQTGPCNIVLNVTEANDPFIHHYANTDGQAGSKCVNPGGGGFIEPCLAKYEWRVKQSKGAWWIGGSMIGGKFSWYGRVSDHEWGYTLEGKWHNPFVTANSVEDGGEVFDRKAREGGPVTPMGNGNKGACTCATPIAAMTWHRKLTLKEGGGTETTNGFWPGELQGMSEWPQRYTAGSPEVGRTELHIGG